MKTLIAYKTRNGASKKYADWLAERYETEAKDFDVIEEKDIKIAKKVFVISGTYGGIMPLTDFVRSRWDILKNKDVHIIAVGMAPEKSWWSKLSFFMLPSSIKKTTKYSKLPGLMLDNAESEKKVRKENLNRIK